jgi:hypothetical protein
MNRLGVVMTAVASAIIGSALPEIRAAISARGRMLPREPRTALGVCLLREDNSTPQAAPAWVRSRRTGSYAAPVSRAGRPNRFADCGPGHRAGTAHGVRAFAHPTRLATLSRMAVTGSSLARYL